MIVLLILGIIIVFVFAIWLCFFIIKEIIVTSLVFLGIIILIVLLVFTGGLSSCSSWLMTTDNQQEETEPVKYIETAYVYIAENGTTEEVWEQLDDYYKSWTRTYLHDADYYIPETAVESSIEEMGIMCCDQDGEVYYAIHVYENGHCWIVDCKTNQEYILSNSEDNDEFKEFLNDVYEEYTTSQQKE